MKLLSLRGKFKNEKKERPLGVVKILSKVGLLLLNLKAAIHQGASNQRFDHTDQESAVDTKND